MEKQNLTQHKHTFTNENKCSTTQNKHKKLKTGLVASYNIQPGNGEGLFLFQRFINLSVTYLQPRAHTGLCYRLQWSNHLWVQGRWKGDEHHTHTPL